MEKLTIVETNVVPLRRPNIDTDQILPARFLHKPRKEGYAQYLFRDQRFAADGAPNADFPLNQSRYAGARIIVAGTNFACGSSRENAVWALYDYGFRVVIAPSFGDIFFSNSLKNGLLPIRLAPEVVDGLFVDLARFPDARIRVDLAAQRVLLPGSIPASFEIDSFAKHCLLNGIDELDYTLTRMDDIVAFERRRDADEKAPSARRESSAA